MVLYGAFDFLLLQISTSIIATGYYSTFFMFNFTSGAVTRVRISRDNSLLFSTGEDGCLYLLDIRDPSGKIKSLTDFDFSDEVLHKFLCVVI